MKPTRLLNLRRSQRGQMAIFIALIFQVLFILFAMAINVALVVHDKINLQNAVDFAAYYAAQRQAEQLNVIAHHNYMIRQSWKLLAWRYRVLGASGVTEPNPHPIYYSTVTDTQFNFSPNAVDPTVCVTHSGVWRDVPPEESLCKKHNVVIPALPQVQVIAGFLGFNVVFAALAERMRQNMANNCSRLGAFNWWYASAIMQAFREDQRNRKQVVYALAKNLSQKPNGDFIDLNGDSVLQGSYTTFERNLTFSNSQAILNFQMHNSLKGLRPDQWLSEIKISPTIVYIDPNTTGTACVGGAQMINNLPQDDVARSLITAPLPNGLGAGDLVQWKEMSVLADSDYQMTLGFEKNPWVMAYVGVQAETSPRPIFLPWGNGVRLTARAYAKPFGGRIGPWYGSRWPRGGSESIGPKTDALLPERLQAGGLLNSPNDPSRLPNYSRHPGDQLGLRSALGLAGILGVLRTPASPDRVPFDYYNHTWKPIENNPAAYNDVVAMDPFNPAMTPFPLIRRQELAAVAPDLFDITYYSIESSFSQLILPKLRANRSALGIPDTVVLRGDLGQNDKNPQAVGFSVKDQMAIAAAPPTPLQRPDAFFFVRDKVNLLTSWTSGDFLYDYSFPANRFGKCEGLDDSYDVKFKLPGSCLTKGGRSGYSVKIISRNLLFSNQQPLGGQDEASGGIVNPPDSGLGW